MCLYSHNAKPYTCDKDIVVYKHFLEDGGSLRTPYRLANARYGEDITADGEVPSLPTDYSSNSVGAGAVHSYISTDIAMAKRADCTCARCVIRAGTPFWVSFDGKCVASRSLHVCHKEEDGRVSGEDIRNDLADAREEICKAARKELANKGGVTVGDALLSDLETYVAPEDVTAGMQPVGIVAFIREDGTPHITALRESKSEFTGFRICNRAHGAVMDRKEAYGDMCGWENTLRLGKPGKGCLAVRPCLSYSTPGTVPGDWYLPSAGEMLRAVRNMFIINMAAEKLDAAVGAGSAERMGNNRDYWTSTFREVPWCCGTAIASLNPMAAWAECAVRPSLRLGGRMRPFNNL